MRETKIILTMVDLRTQYPDQRNPFRVRSVTNTIEFKVNDYLTVDQVQDLLSNRKDIDIKLITG